MVFKKPANSPTMPEHAGLSLPRRCAGRSVWWVRATEERRGESRARSLRPHMCGMERRRCWGPFTYDVRTTFINATYLYSLLRIKVLRYSPLEYPLPTLPPPTADVIFEMSLGSRTFGLQFPKAPKKLPQLSKMMREAARNDPSRH